VEIKVEMVDCPLCDEDAFIPNPKREDHNERSVEYYCQMGCGTYKFQIHELLGTALNEVSQNERYLLSAMTRQASDNGEVLALRRDNAVGILTEAQKLAPKTLHEEKERVLRLLHEKTSESDDLVYYFEASKDYQLAFLRNGTRLQSIIRLLGNQNLVECKVRTDQTGCEALVLTPRGWDEAERAELNEQDIEAANGADVDLGRTSHETGLVEHPELVEDDPDQADESSGWWSRTRAWVVHHKTLSAVITLVLTVLISAIVTDAYEWFKNIIFGP
jgi:hypothetical protein